MFGFLKRELDPWCISCESRKPIAEFDRTWEFNGGIFGYCLRCNGKAFTAAEIEARREAIREAGRLRREQEKNRRAALSPEERARENQERRTRQREAAEKKEYRKKLLLRAIEELNRERAANGDPPIDPSDVKW